jgi:spore maturation protein CgeB
LERCFEPDKEVIVFEDEDDLQRKVEFYLAHPEKLETIARAARRRVLAEHTFDHRAQTILRHLGGS